MNMNRETMYWKSNADWYDIDENYKYWYRIKTDAPERAKKSYELWLQHQEPRYTEEDLIG